MLRIALNVPELKPKMINSLPILNIDGFKISSRSISRLESQSGSKTSNAGVYHESLGIDRDPYRTIRLSKVPKPATESEIRVKKVRTLNISFLNHDNQIVDGLILKDWNDVIENVRLQDPEQSIRPSKYMLI